MAGRFQANGLDRLLWKDQGKDPVVRPEKKMALAFEGQVGRLFAVEIVDVDDVHGALRKMAVGIL